MTAVGLTLSIAPAVASSLSFYLDFESDLADQSGNGIVTTPTAPAPALSSDVPAAIGSGNSGSFDGDTTWIDVTPAPQINPAAFTLMYFIKAGAQNGPFERFTSRGGFEFDTAIDGGGQLHYFNGGAWVATGTTVPVGSSTWNHIAWQSDGVNLRLYVDGVLAFTGSSPGALAQFMRIGAVQSAVGVGSEGFLGLIDDFALFDDTANPLTPADIALIASNGVRSVLNDGDGDGLPDSWEQTHNLDPDDNGLDPNNNGVAGNPDNGAAGDPDLDTVTNNEEFNNGTDPRDSDSDDDTIPDAQEIAAGTNPNDPDTDGDGLTDAEEAARSTDPLDSDSDDDGFKDGAEVANGTDPLDGGSTPDPAGVPVLHLNFDDNVVDQSGGGNDGNLINGASYGTDVPAALGGGAALALANDGTADGQGVVVQDDPALSAQSFTLAYWIKPTSGQAGTAGLERLTSRTADSFETAIGDASAAGGTTSPSGITLSYFSTDLGAWVVTDVEIVQGAWVHVAWVNSVSGMELFLDGTSVFTGSAVASSGSGRMNVGTRHSEIEGFEGMIDDLRLYMAPLSAEQVMALASGAGGGLEFTITGISRSADGSEVTITWNSQPGRFYRVQFSSDLTNWSEITDGATSASTTATFTDTLFAPLNLSGGSYRVLE